MYGEVTYFGGWTLTLIEKEKAVVECQSKTFTLVKKWKQETLYETQDILLL